MTRHIPSVTNLQGQMWMLASVVCFSTMGMLIRSLEGSVHSLQIVFIRCVFALVLITPVILHQGVRRTFKTRSIHMHLWRAGIGMMAMFCMFTAFQHLPLVTMTTISYTQTLFVTLLAVPLLGEKVGWRRVAAIAAGFLGTLVVLRPGADDFNAYALLAFGGAFLVASAMISVKHLTKTHSSLTVLAYFCLFSVPLSAIPALIVWEPVSADEILKILMIAAVALGGQYFAVRAYHAGDIGAVAPVSYLSLIFSFLYGYFLFHEVPDVITLAGAAMIVGSTAYVSYREYRLKRRRKKLLDQSPSTAAPTPPI